jgi:hypothetical protein
MEEWFSEPEPNVIESSTGYTVKVLGQTGLRYTEGDCSVLIDSEVLAKPGAIAMFKDSIKAWEGRGEQAGVPVTDQDRERIAENVKRAFEFCGYELEVQSDFDWH